MKSILKSVLFFIGIIVFLFLTIILSGGGVSIAENWPTEFSTFKLSDSKGRYIINYDGDYWLTYYQVDQQCYTEDSKEICSEELTKKGAAAITETPVDLSHYIDKNVRVTGSFVGIIGSIAPHHEEHQLCIKKGFFKKECKKTGPSWWHSSPIKISSITLEEK